MVMPTQILTNASEILSTVLIQTLQVYNVGEPTTKGIKVSRELQEDGEPIPGLVQSILATNLGESKQEYSYSIKVPRGVPLRPGQVVEVLTSPMEPELMYKKFLIKKISYNGASLIRKATADSWESLNQEGKGELQHG